jgi:hypothetical protein
MRVPFGGVIPSEAVFPAERGISSQVRASTFAFEPVCELKSKI